MEFPCFLGHPTKCRGRHAPSQETAEDIVGGTRKRLENPGQAGQRTQARRKVIALQVVGLIEGTMALFTVGAIIVRAFQANLARGGYPTFGSVVDEAGVRLAVGTDDTGAAVAFFSRPSGRFGGKTKRVRGPGRAACIRSVRSSCPPEDRRSSRPSDGGSARHWVGVAPARPGRGLRGYRRSAKRMKCFGST